MSQTLTAPSVARESDRIPVLDVAPFLAGIPGAREALAKQFARACDDTGFLVIANHVARSPLLVFGVLLWAGAPIWYSVGGKVFVSSQITEQEAGRIGRIKRRVLVTTLVGLALSYAFLYLVLRYGVMKPYLRWAVPVASGVYGLGRVIYYRVVGVRHG